MNTEDLVGEDGGGGWGGDAIRKKGSLGCFSVFFKVIFWGL